MCLKNTNCDQIYSQQQCVPCEYGWQHTLRCKMVRVHFSRRHHRGRCQATVLLHYPTLEELVQVPHMKPRSSSLHRTEPVGRGPRMQKWKLWKELVFTVGHKRRIIQTSNRKLHTKATDSNVNKHPFTLHSTDCICNHHFQRGARQRTLCTDRNADSRYVGITLLQYLCLASILATCLFETRIDWCPRKLGVDYEKKFIKSMPKLFYIWKNMRRIWRKNNNRMT